jgi:hypothetical protein
VDGDDLAGQHDRGLAPVDLGALAGGEGQRHEDRPPPPLELGHAQPDGRLAAGVAVPLDQLPPHLTGGAPLLGRLLLVLVQPLPQERHDRVEPGTLAGPRLPVARRLGRVLGQVLGHRDAGDAQLARDGALRQPLRQVEEADTFLDGHLNHLIVPLCRCSR